MVSGVFLFVWHLRGCLSVGTGIGSDTGNLAFYHGCFLAAIRKEMCCCVIR